MAIVFDTQAELEAFCEMFELRSMVPERSVRKFSRKFIQDEKGSEKGEQFTQESKSPTLLDVLPVPKEETTCLEMELGSESIGESTVLLASAS